MHLHVDIGRQPAYASLCDGCRRDNDVPCPAPPGEEQRVSAMLHERTPLRSKYFRELADRGFARLRRARVVADRCLYDERLHRDAMKAVFALEDAVFALEQIARLYEEANDNRYASWYAIYPVYDAWVSDR